jgi:hypothetical protein
MYTTGFELTIPCPEQTLLSSARQSLYEAFKEGVSEAERDSRLQAIFDAIDDYEDNAVTDILLNEVYDYAIAHGLTWEEITRIESKRQLQMCLYPYTSSIWGCFYYDKDDHPVIEIHELADVCLVDGAEF